MPHQQSRAKEMEKFYQTEMSEEAEGFPEKWREGGGGSRWSEEDFFFESFENEPTISRAS